MKDPFRMTLRLTNRECLIFEVLFSLLGPYEIQENPGPIYRFEKPYITIEENKLSLTFSETIKESLEEKLKTEIGEIRLVHPLFEKVERIQSIDIYLLSENQLEIELNPKSDPPMEKSYLSIDLGNKNPITLLNSKTGECLILGREMKSRVYYFTNKIGKLKDSYKIHGLETMNTQKMKSLTNKRKNVYYDSLQKVTRYIADYCSVNVISKVVIGEITKRECSFFEFNEFCTVLERKLNPNGIELVIQDEMYTSQCSPLTLEVSKEYADKDKRITRGLFKDGKEFFNADGVGALNILKRYLGKIGKTLIIPLEGIKSPTVKTVSV